jgi:hypothetical protein
LTATVVRIGAIRAVIVLVVVGALAAACGGIGASARPNGQIVFGTAVDMTTFTVTTPVTTVAAGTQVGWVAYFSESANNTKLTITIARLNSGGAEESLFSGDQDVANPQVDTWAHDLTDAISTQGPGQYTLRYIRPTDQTVLAMGTLSVTP